MKKLVITLVILGIVFGLYSGGMAGLAYVTISNLLDEVVPRQIGTSGAPDQHAATERNNRIRAAVVQSVVDAGLAVEPADVAITEDGGRLVVRVGYQHPLVRLQGETKAAIPVSVTSSFPLPPVRN